MWLQVLGIRNHFTFSNLLFRTALVAEFADSQAAALHAHGGAKGAAGHRSPFIEVTSALHWIQCRTRFFVSKVFKPLPFFFGPAKQTGRRISGKIRRQARNRFASALSHSFRPRRVAEGEFVQTVLQSCCVKLIDRERSDAARRASFPADKPALAPARCIGKRGIHDLNQFLISRNWESRFHSLSILSGKTRRNCCFDPYDGIFALD